MAITTGFLSHTRSLCARTGVRQTVCAARVHKSNKQGVMHLNVPRYEEALVEVSPSNVIHDQEVIDWGLEVLGIDKLWRMTRGKGVKVAVLDTGVDLNHADLPRNMVAKDFTGSRYGAQDKHGHGTHCAGIVAARDNDIGVIGVAPKATLLCGKVLDDRGRGDFRWITAGINWAVDQGADIISMSLGASVGNNMMKQAISRAIARGVIVLAAAGNDYSSRQDNINYPGNYPEVICVGSIGRDGKRSPFSSVGYNIDIMAPGGFVRSCWIPPFAYRTISGTSMATPFVAGVCALALAKNRASGGQKINQQRMFELLRDSATDLSDPDFNRRTGWGLVDVGFIENLSLLATAEAETDEEGEDLASMFQPFKSRSEEMAVSDSDGTDY